MSNLSVGSAKSRIWFLVLINIYVKVITPADKAINNTEKKAVNRTMGFDLKQPPWPADDVFCCCLENDCLFVEIPVITEIQLGEIEHIDNNLYLYEKRRYDVCIRMLNFKYSSCFIY